MVAVGDEETDGLINKRNGMSQSDKSDGDSQEQFEDASTVFGACLLSCALLSIQSYALNLSAARALALRLLFAVLRDAIFSSERIRRP